MLNTEVPYVVQPSELSSINTLYGVSLPGQSGWSRIADERLEKIDESSLEVKLSSTHLGECEDESEKHGIPSKLPTGQEFGVLLKVYDEDIAESIRVAQVVDIIGILDECSLPSTEWTTSEEAPSESSDPLHPTIHVISMHKASTPSIDVVKADQQIREALLARLTQVLQGDVLAAEWLLLSLIARLYVIAMSIRICKEEQLTKIRYCITGTQGQQRILLVPYHSTYHHARHRKLLNCITCSRIYYHSSSINPLS